MINLPVVPLILFFCKMIVEVSRPRRNRMLDRAHANCSSSIAVIDVSSFIFASSYHDIHCYLPVARCCASIIMIVHGSANDLSGKKL